ncbi:hypothetical protein EVAR_315_1 [Eumeta japonica]|uniref:Uncharacterized protein n=1 Tax=Eumeta variegata TaxID=151549 RepID=A0A4C1SAN5_EUMVA|nr:hypothetical protein EVAR_315_1 [Eumeta japonica]
MKRHRKGVDRFLSLPISIAHEFRSRRYYIFAFVNFMRTRVAVDREITLCTADYRSSPNGVRPKAVDDLLIFVGKRTHGTTLTRTWQPLHVALAAAVVAAWLARGGGCVRPWRALYVAAVAVHLGTQVWMTLVSGEWKFLNVIRE